MTTERKSFNEVITVVPEGRAFSELPKGLLAKSDKLKVVSLVVSAGEEIAEHKAGGDIAVLCLVGHVDFTAGETLHHLDANQFLCLSSGTPHSVKAVKDSVLLVTVCRYEMS